MYSPESRWLWRITVLWGAAIFWLAPHPPMIDLPQHAGQVALLRDMLLGESPWADLFRINLFTPYLLGYGLALPLSLVMPVAVALKILLSLAYLAFVFFCVWLRRHFGVDERLDWLALPGFFGFAYHWGFFTFLLAAPIGLWFILRAERFSQRRTVPRAIGLTLLGLVLLASHGLVFLFAYAIGALTMALRLKQTSLKQTNLKQTNSHALAVTPYLLLGLACVAYFLINRHINAGMQTELASVTTWNAGLMRLPKAIIYTLSANIAGREFVLWGAAMALFFALPWLLGLRISLRRKPAWIPFLVLLGIFLLVPSNAAGTVFLYQRFGLFLLPTYAWLFGGPPTDNKAHKLAIPLLILVCWAVLGVYSERAWRFGRESADFDQIMSRLEPSQRALMLIFDPDSPTAGMRLYSHYPAWYQAEKHGLVDFNFAWFPPQIVRYRADKLPAVKPGFEWHSERFDWVENRGGDYRYFFVRSDKPVGLELFRGADCMPQLVEESGEWRVFEYRGCH